MLTDDRQGCFCLDVWGDYACFTRPEMKVERVSYDVITPSAARGIFEAILWKPAIRWEIRKIEVINPIQWISIRRNEVGAVMSDRSKEGLMIEEKRQQKAGLLLRNVRYRLHAYLDYLDPEKRKAIGSALPGCQLDSGSNGQVRDDETPGKYLAMFERRARKGQCFNQPYLGCREFSCGFRLIDNSSREPASWQKTMDLGFMLYDMDFGVDPATPPPAFFRAKMENGVINVPAWESEEVYR
ncbi:MAG: type I-C CRISPR-associated protein Cas5c [Pseudomonadota bacterium]